MSITYELKSRVALDKYGFKNTRSLGQNFLFDEVLLSGLIDETGVGKDDDVLEIGPGAGVMTALLSDRVKKVLSIELDKKLEPVLSDILSGKENARVVFCDAMSADIASLTSAYFGNESYRVVANLPYYITTDIIIKLLTSRLPITDMCLMVQKEAAERLMSSPGEKQWNATTALIDYYASVEVLRQVPREAFDPVPHVDSAFIRVSPHNPMPVKAQDDGMMRKVINSAFLMRRKKLANNLKVSFSITQDTAVKVLEDAGIDADIRGEMLDIPSLVNLCDELVKTL